MINISNIQPIDIDRLPDEVFNILVNVNNQTERFSLTKAIIQNGDTVKQLDTGTMYFVVDDTNLDSPIGYSSYTAGTASSVNWSGITNKPTSFTPIFHDNMYHSEKVQVYLVVVIYQII
jgi:hypothetical protein